MNGDNNHMLTGILRGALLLSATGLVVGCGDTTPETSDTSAQAVVANDVGGGWLDAWQSDLSRAFDAVSNGTIAPIDAPAAAEVFEVPDRLAGPDGAAPIVGRWEVYAATGAALTSFSPLDWPLDADLDADLAARQRAAVDPAFANHPDMGRRAAADPAGTFERLDLRTPTSRTLELADGTRLFVAFPRPAFTTDADGWLRHDAWRFDVQGSDVVLRSAAGTRATLPANPAQGVSLTTADGRAVDLLSDLAITVDGPSGAAGASLPEAAPEAFDVWARWWDASRDLGLRLDGLHGGVAWSMTFGANWGAGLAADATDVRVSHATRIDGAVSLRFDGETKGAGTTCDDVEIVDAAGATLAVMTAPRLFDAADAERGYGAGRCGGAVTQHVALDGDTLTVTHTIDAAWLRAGDRAWPVVLDPEYTFNFNRNQQNFGTVYNSAIYSNTPTIGRPEWGDRDARRGFYVWPLNGFPVNGWALRSDREIVVEGHRHADGSVSGYNRSEASNVEIRWVNYYRESDWRPATWTGSNPTADGNTLYGSYFSDFWHSNPLIGTGPTPAGWEARCTGAGCNDGIVITETESNDTFPMLGAQSGPAQCSNSCSSDNNGTCEDGGPGYDAGGCSFGTDCDDCGTRQPLEVIFEGALTPNDIDHFGVQMTYEPAIRIEVETVDGSPCDLDGVLEMRFGGEVIDRADGQCPVIDTCADNPTWSCSLMPGGAYGISFRGYAPFDVGNYRIRVTVDRNPDTFPGLYRARWRLGTTFNDSPVNVLDANHGQNYINEMWRNLSRGTAGDAPTQQNGWYGVTRRSNSTSYPIFVLHYAEPVTQEPQDFEWTSRDSDSVRWEWDHAVNARWYELSTPDGSTVIADNLFRYYEVSPGVYRYYVDETGLVENTCYRRAVRGDNEIGAGPISAPDQIATLARNPIVPTAPTSADGDFVVSTLGDTVTVNFTYALPSLAEPDGCDTPTNQSTYEVRLASCGTGAVMPGTQTASTDADVDIVSPENCAHIEVRYINMDGIPTPWTRTAFQVFLDTGLVAPSNFGAVDRDVQSITWGWTDTTSSEDEFVVADDSGVTRGVEPSTTTAATGGDYTWLESFGTGPGGNLPYTRNVRAREGSDDGPVSPDATAYTLPRTARFDSGAGFTWTATDAIVADLSPVGGAYQASIVIGAQPNNATNGCSGAIVTRCRMVGGVPTECTTVSAGTQSGAAGDGTCAGQVADGQFDGRGYGTRYDGGGIVFGDGLFAGRPEGLVLDGGLQYGETYRYEVAYINGDDFPGGSDTFEFTVGCCFDPGAAGSGYYGDPASCEGVCGGAVQGAFLVCLPPDDYVGDEADCDGQDNDCDGDIDESAPDWFLDADNDGFGDPATAVASCGSPGPGYVSTGGDCNDADPFTNPAAIDVCDGIDNDCNPASNDGSSDGALGAICDTGMTGTCATGAVVCGDPGSRSTSFTSSGDVSDWTSGAGASWSISGGSWNVSGNDQHDVRTFDASYAAGSFRAELVFSNGDNDQMGLAWDVTGSQQYAYVIIDLGDTDGAGNENVRIGRRNGGWNHALSVDAFDVGVDDRTRLVVQAHDGTISVWAENITDGTGLVYVGSADIGPSTVGNVGVFTEWVDDGAFESFSVQGAELACQSNILPDSVPEICDGLDNDCDGNIDEGFGVGQACDDGDADLCTDGVQVCNAAGDGTDCANRGAQLVWNFDEGAGTTAADASGNDFAGELKLGATYTSSARFGAGALELSGNNGYVTRLLDVDEDHFTLGAWFRTTDTDGGIFSVVAGDDFGSAGNDRHLYVNNGYLGYRVWNGASSSCDNQGPRVDNGAWHHGAIVCDRGAACTLYLDGVAICTSTDAASTYSHFTAQDRFTVGHSQDEGRFDGQIDHVTVHEFAMSAAQVTALVANGVFTPETGANAEVCDGLDNDCNVATVEDARQTYYRDSDGDGYGDPDVSSDFCGGDPSVLGGGWVTDNTDCDDTQWSVNPGAAEIVGDEIDQTCDGQELCYVDADRDQARVNTVVLSVNDVLCQTADGEARVEQLIDCDDTNPAIFPGAIEQCDGLDNDCDGLIDEGFAAAFDDLAQPTSSCGVGTEIPTGSRLQNIFNARGEAISAVDDGNIVPETFYPVFGDLTFHFVAEGAGYENTFGWYNAGDDVSNPANRFPIFDCAEEPGPSMVRTVNFDNNPNWDGGPIGFFITTPQDIPGNCATNTNFGYAYYTQLGLNTGDIVCVDQPYLHYLVYKSTAYDSTYYFGFEDLFRGGDNDFEDVLVMVEGLVGENEWHYDGDLDGFGDPDDYIVACTPPPGYVNNADDCSDTDPGVRPGAPELCDGVDNNCTGAIDDEGEDADGDGWTTCQGDCDDNDPTVNLDDLDGDEYDTCGSVRDDTGAVLENDILPVIGDSTIQQVGTNHGDETSLAVGNSSGDDPARTAIVFDLSAIPADAQIIKAEAFFYAYTRYDENPGSVAPIDRNIAAHRVLLPWAENLVDAADTGIDSTPWGTLRVGIDDADAEAASLDQTLITSGDTTFPVGWTSWDVTDAVQAWVDGAPNYGLLLRSVNEGDDGFDIRFFSSEYGVIARRPYLRVTYNGNDELVDCADLDPAIHPNADEICDQIDNDCDGDIDDDDLDYPDNDGDGSRVCDCNDNDPNTYLAAPELCDYRDNDCDPSTAADYTFNLGLPCDEAGDADACTDGVIICSNDLTVATCSDGASSILRFENEDPLNPGLAFDWSGDAATGTLVGGATYGNGFYGRHGIDFVPGTGSAVRIARDQTTGLEFTVSAWVYPTMSGDRFVISRTSDAGSNGLAFGIEGQLWFANQSYDDAALALQVGAWTHVALTFDRRYLRVYLNGNLEGTVPIGWDDQHDAWTSDVWFGQELDSPDGGITSFQAFGGSMDDLTWYQHALSQPQILAMMAGPAQNDVNAEFCDGFDNDCRAGIDDPYILGVACDGADPDSCTDGMTICAADGLHATCGDGAGGLYDFEDDALGGWDDATGAGRQAVGTGFAADASIGGRTAVWLPGNDNVSAVRIPGSAAQAPQFTFGAWVYPTSGDDDESIVSVGSERSMTCSQNGFSLTTGGTLGLNCDTVNVPQLDLPTDTWSHVAVSFDGVVVRAYRDGDTTPVAVWDPCVSTGPFDLVEADCRAELRSFTVATDIWVGQEQDMPNDGFDANQALAGYVDDIAWYNHAMPGSDIANLANGFDPADLNAETCDRADNDCNGIIDDPFPTLDTMCSVGVGACAGEGFWICAADGDGVICDGAAGVATDEICDGIDNDCDGVTDENELGNALTDACYTGPAGTEGVGACSAGLRTCVDGAWGACGGQVLPSEETCDGEDNDCDGTTDRNPSTGAWLAEACYSGAAGTEGVGLCSGGNRTCTAAGEWGACLGEVVPQPETCDSEDNDCDGIVDGFTESCYSGPAGTEGVGACSAGARLCDDGSWGACTGEVLPEAPTCSATDDLDCDGSPDDNCLDAIVEILGVVSGDPDTDYTACDQTDGSAILCTFMTVRITNSGEVAIPDTAEVTIYREAGAGRVALAGPFPLPTDLAAGSGGTFGDSIDIAYCFNPAEGYDGVTITAELELGDGRAATDTLASQTLVECGEELCDGYDNDGDGEIDEAPDACLNSAGNATLTCVYGEIAGDFICVASATAEEACGEDGCGGSQCELDIDCAVGEFCSDGVCMHSGRTESTPEPFGATMDDQASSGDPANAGCSSAPRSANGAWWFAMVGLALAVVRHRR